MCSGDPHRLGNGGSSLIEVEWIRFEMMGRAKRRGGREADLKGGLCVASGRVWHINSRYK